MAKNQIETWKNTTATKELASTALRQLAKLQKAIPLSDPEVADIRKFIESAARKLPTEKAVLADVLRKRKARAVAAGKGAYSTA